MIVAAPSRRNRFRRAAMRAGLKPASRIQRPPEVDLKINAAIEGEGSPWLPIRKAAR